MRLLLLTLLLCFINIPVQAGEGAGLIYSDLQGALPKGMWRKQRRSEINYLLKNLPADSDLRSLQVIKRNMLISTYSTHLMIHDTDGAVGDDLLTLRLAKLYEMGLWQDAFTLYTNTTPDPKDNDKLAQIGVLLILSQKGLSTACLEEKVLSPRYKSAFWRQMDKVCAIELGLTQGEKPEFSDSAVLQAIFYNQDFYIPARDISVLENLTHLELAVLSLKRRIDYGRTDLSLDIPPILTKTFLNAPNFPEHLRESLKKRAIRQNLLPESPLTDAQIEQEKDVESLSQGQIIPLITKQLRLELIPSENMVNRLLELASTHAQNYFYVQILRKISGNKGLAPVSEENFNFSLRVFSPDSQEKVNFLKSLLDKPPEFSNNPDNVYEKQLRLTPNGDYVIANGSLTNWLEKTKQRHFVGLSLLIILSNDKTKDAEASAYNNMLNSLSTVGLIDQTHLVAKEELANLMSM